MHFMFLSVGISLPIHNCRWTWNEQYIMIFIFYFLIRHLWYEQVDF